MATFVQMSRKKAIQLQRWGLVIAVSLLFIKLSVWYFTLSNAILTDALESLVNISASFLALYSLRYAAMPRDIDHPNGHGKIEFLSSGTEGFLITIAGLAMMGKAIFNIFHPVELQNLNWAIVFIGVTGVVNGVWGSYLVKASKIHHSIVLKANGKHLISDAISTAGLITGLLIIQLTGWVILDNILAILLGLYIAYEGYKILSSALAGVMDKTDFGLIKKVVRHLDKIKRPDWIDIHNLRIIKYGSNLHVDCHLTLPWYYNVRQQHDTIDLVESELQKFLGAETEVFIHVDPCVEPSCALCSLDCEFRQHKYEGAQEWSMSDLMANAKHQRKKEKQ